MLWSLPFGSSKTSEIGNDPRVLRWRLSCELGFDPDAANEAVESQPPVVVARQRTSRAQPEDASALSSGGADVNRSDSAPQCRPRRRQQAHGSTGAGFAPVQSELIWGAVRSFLTEPARRIADQPASAGTSTTIAPLRCRERFSSPRVVFGFAYGATR
jgi:hypothetical protein